MAGIKKNRFFPVHSDGSAGIVLFEAHTAVKKLKFVHSLLYKIVKKYLRKLA